jgi:ribonuclease BN (tRNA processing enzyme)
LNDNIIKYGAGADLVIHEVAAISTELLKLPAFQHIMSIHVTPSQAGTVFTRIHPKLAAYSHAAFPRLDGRPTLPPVAVQRFGNDAPRPLVGQIQSEHAVSMIGWPGSRCRTDYQYSREPPGLP